MAILHITTSNISRGSGRSATAASAYRAGEKIKDARTGETHDYRRKTGVEYKEILTPTGESCGRDTLWNLAEKADTRKNSTTAREWVIALPHELSPSERQRLAVDFAKTLVARYQCAADICIHSPGKDGDNRNHHAHILCTTRTVKKGLVFGEKTDMEISRTDMKKRGVESTIIQIKTMRQKLADIINLALAAVGISERVDARSYREQENEKIPTKHLGPTLTALERRGQATDIGDFNRLVGEVRSELEEQKELETSIENSDKATAKAPAEEAPPSAPERQAADKNWEGSIKDIWGVDDEEQQLPPPPEKSHQVKLPAGRPARGKGGTER